MTKVKVTHPNCGRVFSAFALRERDIEPERASLQAYIDKKHAKKCPGKR